MELKEIIIRKVVDNLKNVVPSTIKSKKQHAGFIFIKSRNDDYQLSVGQKFLYCKYNEFVRRLKHGLMWASIGLNIKVWLCYNALVILLNSDGVISGLGAIRLLVQSLFIRYPVVIKYIVMLICQGPCVLYCTL